MIGLEVCIIVREVLQRVLIGMESITFFIKVNASLLVRQMLLLVRGQAISMMRVSVMSVFVVSINMMDVNVVVEVDMGVNVMVVIVVMIVVSFIDVSVMFDINMMDLVMDRHMLLLCH